MQLEKAEILFGKYDAPYFPGPDFEFDHNGRSPHADGAKENSKPLKSKPPKLTSDARQLWAGYRSIAEYAKEAFPVEEEQNGKTWMRDKTIST